MLKEGDLVKLGRVKFRVRELRGSPSLGSNKNDHEKQAVNTVLFCNSNHFLTV